MRSQLILYRFFYRSLLSVITITLSFIIFSSIIMAQIPEECLNGQEQAEQIIASVQSSNGYRMLINPQKEAYTSLVDAMTGCSMEGQTEVYKNLDDKLRKVINDLATTVASDCTKNKELIRGFDLVNLALWKGFFGTKIADQEKLIPLIKNCFKFRVTLSSDMNLLSDNEDGSHYTTRSYLMKSDGVFYGEIENDRFIIKGPSILNYEKFYFFQRDCTANTSTTNGSIDALLMDIPNESITSDEDLRSGLSLTLQMNNLPTENINLSCPMMPSLNYQEMMWYSMFIVNQQTGVLNDFNKGDNGAFATYSKTNTNYGDEHFKEVINFSIYHTP